VSHAFSVGAVLHWKAFDLDRPPGTEIKPKFLVVIGAKPGHDVLMILATTHPHHRDLKPGCNAEEGYYYIPGVAKQGFNENTWLLLNEPKVASAALLVKQGLSGNCKVVRSVDAQIAAAIINCLKKIDDVSDLHLSLL
jgi:hypothetical protein